MGISEVLDLREWAEYARQWLDAWPDCQAGWHVDLTFEVYDAIRIADRDEEYIRYRVMEAIHTGSQIPGYLEDAALEPGIWVA